MLSRLEDPNDSNAIARKEAELLRNGFCEVDSEDLPQPKEFRKFAYSGAGSRLTQVIEWEDETPVGCGIPLHA